jgi:hypothetical protein
MAVEICETYNQRAAFLRDVYWNRFEVRDALGAVARQLQASPLRWDTLRNRTVSAWPRLLTTWGIDPAPLVEAWEKFTEEKS